MKRDSLIHSDECLEDLQRDGLFIIQKKEGFRFGTDAVLLSDFAAGKRHDKILDLCTGTAVVPILLSAKTNARRIDCVEIQPEIADMARRCAAYNHLSDRIFVREGDLKDCGAFYEKHSFDAVTCNPPYMKAGKNVKNNLDTKTIARHEVLCSLEDVVRAAADMLRFRGSFYLVHRPGRIADIFIAMRKYGIEPKAVQFVHSAIEKPPSLILTEGSFRGGEELKILPPRIL